MREQSTIYRVRSDDFVPPKPSQEEIALIASVFDELLLLVQRLDDSEDD
ncbi:hypothetical protein AB6Q56_07000 [Dechloromonas sp. ARDL1]